MLSLQFYLCRRGHQKFNMSKNKQIALLGALLSDFNVSLWALVTENETGQFLETRKSEIKAKIESIGKIVDSFEN